MKINYQKLLQGCYEADRIPKKFSHKRIVPDFAFNVLNRFGKLYTPVVDEHFLDNGGKKPVWLDGKPFAVCLTHDVDNVSLFSVNKILRKRRLALSNTGDVAQKIKTFIVMTMDLAKLTHNVKQKDPLHCYERWLEVEREVDAYSTFFFWPGWENIKKRHRTDCSYKLSDHVFFDAQKCSVAEMICEIDRQGWEIGLHPSWRSFDDADELKYQKDALEKILGHEIMSLRQHYLHYDIRITPRIQADAGFKYDSTLGFNDNVGFRFGTCYPWRLFDIEAEEELPILEIPLILQDGAMLNPKKGLRLDEDTAFDYVMQMTEAVEKVGGVLTLIWHSNSVSKTDWWNLYLRTLKYLKKRNPWFTTVNEVGKWYKTKQGLCDP